MTDGDGVHYVVPNTRRGGWDLRRGDGKRSIKHFTRRNEAITYAREVSENQNTKLVIKK